MAQNAWWGWFTVQIYLQDVTIRDSYPYDIVRFVLWDLNPILLHGFRRPHVELKPGRTHIYSCD